MDDLSDEELLKQRFCDLSLTIAGSEIATGVTELYAELAAKQILFQPECYLADEWLCPDEEPIIGIPFYLAHPRLKKLEMKMMLEIEGGHRDQFMKLLRHECGHAINYAYRFYKKKSWNDTFGPFKAPYPDSYRPRPYSKRFVRHLQNGYAQYHPDEDFSETFAVWLTPNSNWEQEYKGWPALHKLKYVDALMKSIANAPPKQATGKKYWDATRMKLRLDAFYKRKQKALAEDLPDFFVPDMKRIFLDQAPAPGSETAARFLHRNRKTITAAIAHWTGRNKLAINRLLQQLIETCREQHLHVSDEHDTTLMQITAYMATRIMNYLHTGKFKPKTFGRTL